MHSGSDLFSVPELLVVGHVTRDLYIGGPRYITAQERRDGTLGGSAAFASRAAARLGVRTTLVTAAPDGFGLLSSLETDPLVRLVRRPSSEPTTFCLDYSGPHRRLTLQGRAPDLVPADIPDAWLHAPLAYIAPVIGECSRALVEHLGAQHVVVSAQGWMRTTNAQGLIIPSLMPELLDPPAGIDTLVFSELDHPEAEALAKHVAARVKVVALTRGALGATLWHNGNRHDIAAAPANEIDPTGAGDVFALVLGLEMQRGLSPVDAAVLAALAAAKVVEGPGLGNLS